jgi:multidrug efflux pump subunit AcrA (membrane-fusion protein)
MKLPPKNNASHPMKSFTIFLCTALLLSFSLAYGSEAAIDPERAANTVILSDESVKNLHIETIETTQTTFTETTFALGRIEPIPSSHSRVSSRVAGRITALKPTLGDVVDAGQEVATLEARVPGHPPPSLTLTAPAKGMVMKIHAPLGSPLEPETPLLELTDLRQVWAIARVPETLAGQLLPGTTAQIKVPALPQEKFTGELIRFGIQADPESGTIDAIFQLQNPNLSLRPQMQAEFSITLKERDQVLSVPRISLQGDATNRFVYVKDFELKNAFVKSPVVIGQMNEHEAEIISGLFPGDEVVTRGAYSLAFAGGGSLSLKEALDAAHGHEHNEDGSEMTAEQKKQKESMPHPHADAHDAHDDHGDHGDHGSSQWWKILSGILALTVLLQAFYQRRDAESAKMSQGDGK